MQCKKKWFEENFKIIKIFTILDLQSWEGGPNQHSWAPLACVDQSKGRLIYFTNLKTYAYAQNKNTGCNRIETWCNKNKLHKLKNKREKLRANESLTFIPSDRVRGQENCVWTFNCYCWKSVEKFIQEFCMKPKFQKNLPCWNCNETSDTNFNSEE